MLDRVQDIRGRLLTANWRIGSEPVKTSVTAHYNGPPIGQELSREQWIAHLREISRYHRDVTNRWKTWRADGICYHYAIIPDGTVFQLRDLDTILWHCAHAKGNAHSIAVHFPLGGNQQPTSAQWAAFEALSDALISKFGMGGRKAVKGHFEWSKSACPGPHLKRRLREYRKEPPTVWFKPPHPYRTQTLTDVHQAPDGSRGIAMRLPAGTVVEIGALVPGVYRAWIANGTGFVNLLDIEALSAKPVPIIPPVDAITPDSAIIHDPRVDEATLVKAICSNPTGEYTRRDIELFIVPAYMQVCATAGVDPLIAVAQMCHETGNLTSRWAARPRRNPAGIGVTGEPGAGLSFPTWARHAIPAHVGRLVVYAIGPDDYTPEQAALVKIAISYRALPSRLWGSAPTLAGLTGTWATDPAYADKLVAWAERLKGDRTT
jgi:hypothetical protein